MKIRAVIVSSMTVILLGGCASTAQYYDSVDRANAQAAEMARAQAEVEIARTTALARIAATGDLAAQVGAVVALAVGNQSQPSRAIVPQPVQSEALQWTQALSGPFTALTMGYFNYRLGSQQSQDSRDIAISTNQSFVGMGNSISTTGIALGGNIVEAATGAYPYINPAILQDEEF